MTVKLKRNQSVLEGRLTTPLLDQRRLGDRQPFPVLRRGERMPTGLAGPLLGLQGAIEPEGDPISPPSRAWLQNRKNQLLDPQPRLHAHLHRD